MRTSLWEEAAGWAYDTRVTCLILRRRAICSRPFLGPDHGPLVREEPLRDRLRRGHAGLLQVAEESGELVLEGGQVEVFEAGAQASDRAAGRVLAGAAEGAEAL